VQGMTQLLSRDCPELLEVATVQECNSGDGLGLFARRAFEEGEEVMLWLSEAGKSNEVMVPNEKLSDKLGSSYYGALAFQVLKAERVDEPSIWQRWKESGVEAPLEHPLKLLFSDPGLAQRLWNSTTCGGRMGAAAAALRDDVKILGGSVDLEEWADALALVMSRSLVEDSDGRPILVLGLDLVNDTDDPTCTVEAVYEAVGGGIFGANGEGQLVFRGASLKAARKIEEGEELSIQYFEYPQVGKYLEIYGFVPRRLRGRGMGPASCELVFAGTDDEDGYVYEKTNVLNDWNIPVEPISFHFEGGKPMSRVQEGMDWDNKSQIDRMITLLRMRHIGGSDSFLMDSVLLDFLWENCNYRVSKENEIEACKQVNEEIARWLDRFEKAREEEAEDGPDAPRIAKWMGDCRENEYDLLYRLQGLMSQEINDVMFSDKVTYWADRQMDKMFPGARALASIDKFLSTTEAGVF